MAVALFLAISIFSFLAGPAIGIAKSEKMDHFAQGAAILKEIEPNFTTSPIFLNPDEGFKTANKAKLLEAVYHLEQALKKDPDNTNTLYLLGTAYSFAHDLEIPGAWLSSVEYLKKAVEIDPDDHKPHMILGKNYMDAQKFEESYREYERVNELVPNGFALRNMAFVRMAQKRTSEGQDLLEKYIEHNPQDDDAKKILSALREEKFEKVET